MSNLYRKTKTFLRKSTAQIILVVLIIFFTIEIREYFFTVNNLISIVRQVSTMGIAALGISFLMITGNLDFSTGAVYAFVGTFTAVMHAMGLNIYIAMMLSLMTSIIIFSLSCWISITFNINRIVVSMAMNMTILGLGTIIAGNKTIYGLPESIKWLGQGYIGPLPISAIIFIGIALIVAFILNKTYFGRYLFAVGGSDTVARLSGINVNKIKYLSSIIAGLLVGIAGLVSMSRTFSGSPYAGGTLSLDVISAAVLGGVSIMGGTGKTSGLVTGIIIMGTLSVGLNMMNMNTNSQDIFKGVMLFIAVILDSRSKTVKAIYQ